MSNMNALALRAAVLATLFGVSGCDYFSTVTLPDTDTDWPFAWASVWKNGEYIDPGYFRGFTGTHDVPVYETTDANELVYALAVSFDTGGARSVTMYREVVVRCPSEILRFEDTIEETQTVGPGLQVSNGIWTGEAFRAGAWFNRCPDDEIPHFVLYTWIVRAEDFFDHTSTLGTYFTPSRILWTPEPI